MKKIFLLILIFSISIQVFAKWTPLKIVVWDDNKDQSVYGLRLGLLYGNNKNLTGFDISTGYNSLEGNLKGFQLGLVNSFNGTGSGIQLALAKNHHPNKVFKGIQFAGLKNTGSVSGLQLSGIYNGTIYKDEIIKIKGFQIAGIINDANTVKGIQASLLLNKAEEKMYGAQFGAINLAKKVRGIQVGLYNYAYELFGIQIGLVNVIRTGEIPVFPLINMGFNF